MSTSLGDKDVLRGTPVVGGVVCAPVLRVSSEVDPVAIERYRERPIGDPDAALAEFDQAIAAVADTFLAKS
ncbi:MAG TPA: hypothetical protein PKK40_07635, partial [Marmoricola sp.]|nr:hypothetical protein [Marmoricola sp.]